MALSVAKADVHVAQQGRIKTQLKVSVEDVLSGRIRGEHYELAEWGSSAVLYGKM